MSDVNETLQELMERRLLELGHRRGRGESLSLREAYNRMLDEIRLDDENHPDDDPMLPTVPTYEVFRRIRNGQTKISDTTARALSIMLGVDEERIFLAAGIPPRLGRFELPTAADRLTGPERDAVLAVVDAILSVDGRNRGPHIDMFWDDQATGVRLFAQVKDSSARRLPGTDGERPDPRQVASMVRETVQNSLNAIEQNPAIVTPVATSLMAARTTGRAPAGQQQTEEERAAELGVDVVRSAQERAREQGLGDRATRGDENSDQGVTGS